LVGISEDDFKKSSLLQDAIVRRIEIIGEATKNLPDNFKAKYSEIPWRQITSTRDFIVHEYFSIDLDLVWEITQKDLPDLKVKITKIISDNF